MAFNKKKARRIEVNGETYYWIVSRKLNWSPPGGEADAKLAIGVWVQGADGKGPKIQAIFDGHFLSCVPALCFDDFQTVTIRPSDVRRVIEFALSKGWSADSTKGNLVLQDCQELFPDTIRPLFGDEEFRPDEHLAPPNARLLCLHHED